MKCINNPTLLAGRHPISVDFVMARTADSSKKLVAAKPFTNSPRLMVDVLAFGFLAPFAYRVESEIGFLNLAILIVFTLALGGCIPQPSAAFHWGPTF
jgi:hypothetical protein